jgi:hypothetical protein
MICQSSHHTELEFKGIYGQYFDLKLFDLKFIDRKYKIRLAEHPVLTKNVNMSNGDSEPLVAEAHVAYEP